MGQKLGKIRHGLRVQCTMIYSNDYNQSHYPQGQLQHHQISAHVSPTCACIMTSWHLF